MAIKIKFIDELHSSIYQPSICNFTIYNYKINGPKNV